MDSHTPRTPSAPTAGAAATQATAQRRARQVASIPEPRFPATGTAMIAARIAEARAMERANRTGRP